MAVLATVYFPHLLGQIVFYRDLNSWVFPARAFVRAAVGAGDSVAWNPAEGLGVPIAASPLYGVWYPGYLATLAPGSLPRVVSWVWLAHVVWGGLGFMLLARRLGLGRVAALVAATAWALSGFTVSAWNVGVLLVAGAQLPWVALGLLIAVRAAGAPLPARARAIAIGAVPVALSLLVGEVFVTTMAVGFGLVVALLGRAVGAADAADAATPSRRARAASLVGAVAVGGALAGVVVVPAWLARSGTARASALPRAVAEHWSLHPLRLLELVAPGAMGDPYGDYPGGRWAGDGSYDGRPLFFGVYLGASVVALALLALGRRCGVAGRLAGGLAGTAIVGLLLALGHHTPVHSVARVLVPILALQRSPEKYLALVVAACALLAALGAQRAVAGEARWGRLVAFGLVLVAAAAASALSRDGVATTIRAGVAHGLLSLTALGVVLGLLARASRVGPPALALTVALDVALAAMPLVKFAPADAIAGRPPMLDLVLAERPASWPPARVFRAPQVEAAVMRHVRVGDIVSLERTQIASLRQSTLTAHGVATVPGYDASRPPLVDALFARARDDPSSLLRLLGVEYVVLPGSDGPLPPVRGLKPVGAPGPPGAALYAVDRPLPRVLVAGAAVVLPDTDALGGVLSADVVAGGRVVLAPDSSARAIDAAATAVPCAVLTYRNTYLEARCTTAAAAHVLFVEQHAPGWTATVDGRPAPLLRANLLARAVPLPPGTHVVALTYRAPGSAAGAVLSLFAAAVAAAGWLAGRASRRSTAAPVV